MSRPSARTRRLSMGLAAAIIVAMMSYITLAGALDPGLGLVASLLIAAVAGVAVWFLSRGHVERSIAAEAAEAARLAANPDEPPVRNKGALALAVGILVGMGAYIYLGPDATSVSYGKVAVAVLAVMATVWLIADRMNRRSG